MSSSYFGSGNEYSANYVENLTPLTEKKRVLPGKIAIVALAAIFTLAVLFLAMKFPGFASLAFIGFLLIGIGVWFLWRFVEVEFEYAIVQGEIRVEKILGRRKRKPLGTFQIKSAEWIGPAGDVPDALKRAGEAAVIFAAAAMDAPETYGAVFPGENGKKTVLYFECTEKALKVISFYNPSHTQKKVLSR